MSPTTGNLQYYLRYTKEEKKLIDEHLPFYIDLDNGIRVPNTEKQWHFVRFCRGIAKANTPHEFAYLKYKRIKSYEDKQKFKPFISKQAAKTKPIDIKRKIKKFNSSSASRSTRRYRTNKKNRVFNNASASAREILDAQDKAMKLQSSRRSNIRNAMAVHSDPRD